MKHSSAPNIPDSTESAARGCVQRVVRGSASLHDQLMKAVDESSDRMSKMTPHQRKRLWKKARAMIEARRKQIRTPSNEKLSV